MEKSMEISGTPKLWIRTGQIAYLSLATGYNLISLWLAANGSQPLAPTKIVPALIVLSVYAGVLCLADSRAQRFYVAGLLIFIALFGYSGIYVHLAHGPQPELYRSALSWFCAIAINVFGLTLNCLAVCVSLPMVRRLRARS
jgi:hypothetical protein